MTCAVINARAIQLIVELLVQLACGGHLAHRAAVQATDAYPAGMSATLH